jgi:hypothetical protein
MSAQEVAQSVPAPFTAESLTAAERCPHGIRYPWQCDDCDRENPMPEGWQP